MGSSGDFALGNILFVLCSFLALLTVVGWLSLFVCRGWQRLLPPLGLALMIGTPFLFFKIREVDGEMIPIIVWRSSPDPDELLEVPPPVAASDDEENMPIVDLATATAEDFPNFLGPNMAQHVTDVELNRDWSAYPPKLVWEQSIGAGWCAFATRNGYAVTMEQRGEQELVTCYEIATGELQWSHGVNTRYETVLGGIGPRATPTIDERGYVYANGATGILRCINGNTGQLVWQADVLKQVGVDSEHDAAAVMYGRSNSPLVVDDYVVVAGGAGPDDAADRTAASLVAFNRDTGEVAWRGGDDQIGYASPIIGKLDGVRQVVSVNEATVSGHDPTNGNKLWQFPWGRPGASAADSNNSQPIIVGDDRLFVSKSYGVGATLMEINQNNAGKWNVEEVWSDPTLLKTKFTNVIVHDGYVYGLSDGILECVELETGEQQWKKGRFHQGQILGVGSVILVIDEKKGEVTMVEMTPRAYRKLGKFAALETDKLWNHLSLYGKYLLVRDAQTAACWELPLAD